LVGFRLWAVDWLTGNPKIEVQPCPTASTGFHSGVRRAGSAVTRYVPFNEGITKFDTEFAVLGYKTASDTKGALCAQTHKRPVPQGYVHQSVGVGWWSIPATAPQARSDIRCCSELWFSIKCFSFDLICLSDGGSHADRHTSPVRAD
jgi:hypothetical protein